MNFNLLSSVYLADTFEPVAKWLTIGFICALAITWIITFFVKKEISGKVAKCQLIALVFYALALGIFLLSIEIAKKYDTAYLDEKWVSRDITTYVFLPLLVTLILALLGAVAIFIVTKKAPNLTKIVSLVTACAVFVGVVVSLILIYIHYSNNIVGDGYYTDENYGNLNSIALWVGSILMIVGTVLVGLLLDKKENKGFDTKCLSVAGVCVALSFALSYIKLFEMPQGGAVTLASMMPVMLFGYIYGTKKGLLVGFVYGMLQAIQDPYIIHPAQFLLDYPVAFAMVGFAGALTNLKWLDNLPQVKFALSACIAGTMRFVCHLIAGVFAFGAWALDAGAENIFLYSLVYNSYVFVDIVLVVIAGAILLSSKAFRQEVKKLNPKEYLK